MSTTGKYASCGTSGYSPSRCFGRPSVRQRPRHNCTGWRKLEHNYLEQALVGMADELPKSVALTQTNFADAAIGAARDAREEIVRALKELKTGAP